MKIVNDWRNSRQGMTVGRGQIFCPSIWIIIYYELCPPPPAHAGRAGGCVVAVAGGGQAWSDCVVSCDTHHPPQIGENWTKLYCLLNLEIIIKCVCDHEWEPQLGVWLLAVTRETHSALLPGHVAPHHPADNSVTVLSIIIRWQTL